MELVTRASNFCVEIGRKVDAIERWLDRGSVGAMVVGVPLLLLSIASIFICIVLFGELAGVSW